jgi:hypothetical protein
LKRAGQIVHEAGRPFASGLKGVPNLLHEANRLVVVRNRAREVGKIRLGVPPVLKRAGQIVHEAGRPFAVPDGTFKPFSPYRHDAIQGRNGLAEFAALSGRERYGKQEIFIFRKKRKRFFVVRQRLPPRVAASLNIAGEPKGLGSFKFRLLKRKSRLRFGFLFKDAKRLIVILSGNGRRHSECRRVARLDHFGQSRGLFAFKALDFGVLRTKLLIFFGKEQLIGCGDEFDEFFWQLDDCRMGRIDLYLDPD